MTGTTPDRAQLSFVRINAAGDDLEAVPDAEDPDDALAGPVVGVHDEDPEHGAAAVGGGVDGLGGGS